MFPDLNELIATYGSKKAVEIMEKEIAKLKSLTRQERKNLSETLNQLRMESNIDFSEILDF